MKAIDKILYDNYRKMFYANINGSLVPIGGESKSDESEQAKNPGVTPITDADIESGKPGTTGTIYYNTDSDQYMIYTSLYEDDDPDYIPVKDLMLRDSHRVISTQYQSGNMGGVVVNCDSTAYHYLGTVYNYLQLSFDTYDEYEDDMQVNEYCGCFTVGLAAYREQTLPGKYIEQPAPKSFTLNLTTGTIIPDYLLNDNNELELEEGHTYEFSIQNNVIILLDITGDAVSNGNGGVLPHTPVTPG